MSFKVSLEKAHEGNYKESQLSLKCKRKMFEYNLLVRKQSANFDRCFYVFSDH